MKKSMFSIQQWEEIINQYQCFNGTMNEFCQVTLKSTKVTKSYPDTNVTFEIGENTVIIPSIEKDLIIEIIKELAALC